MDIYAKLREILADKVKKCDIAIEDITPDTELDALGLDSLDKAELIISIEETFGLPETTLDEMAAIVTVEDVKNLIEKKRLAK